MSIRVSVNPLPQSSPGRERSNWRRGRFLGSLGSRREEASDALIFPASENKCECTSLELPVILRNESMLFMNRKVVL